MLNDPRQAAAMRSAGVSAQALALWRMKIALARLDPPSASEATWNAGARFLEFAHRHGVDILPGTDLGVPFVYPGLSLIEELEILVHEIGLTSAQALASATCDAARWFGLAEDLGTIEAGKLADVVLLGSNPAIRISNLRNVRGVMAGGRYYTRSDLHRLIITSPN
jgi:imidazolonepropionase-like amidohydrolase